MTRAANTCRSTHIAGIQHHQVGGREAQRIDRVKFAVVENPHALCGFLQKTSMGAPTRLHWSQQAKMAYHHHRSSENIRVRHYN